MRSASINIPQEIPDHDGKDLRVFDLMQMGSVRAAVGRADISFAGAQ